MRKIMTFGIAFTLALAVGTWAAANSRARNQVGLGGDRIHTFELMKNTKKLPVHQYDAF